MMFKTNGSMTALNRQKGYTMVEVILGVALVAMVLAIIFDQFNNAKNSTTAQRFSNEIAMMTAQSRIWKGSSPHYTGISVTALTNLGMLDNNWGAGTGVNPAGGNYALAVNSTDATILNVTTTGMANEFCLNVARTIQSRTVGGSGASCSSGTLTAQFR
jgi:prepilin-type N-terminal cleavage/methylation domain-containing protein